VQVTVDVYEPANASGVETVLFFYQVDGGQWWNTTMTLNTTSNLWTVIVPSQSVSCTVEFYLIACDKAGNVNTSSMCTYAVNSLPIGDINGDGVVDSTDLGIMGAHWGETE
jgi:hypothetical protein